jgi:hypothetical protein
MKLSRDLAHILYSRAREVPDELPDAFIKLCADFIRPIMQPDHRDVFQADTWARDRLGIADLRRNPQRVKVEKKRAEKLNARRERENA